MTYTITDLGVLPGGSSNCNCSYGNGINASGQVAGFAQTPNSNPQEGGAFQATLFNYGQVTGLGFIQIPTYEVQSSYGYGINGYGEVTGTGNAADPYETDAFLYSAGTMKDIGRLNLDDDDATGYSINDSGEIVGTSTKDNPNSGPARIQAFLYNNGKMTNLGTLPGGGGGPGGFGEATYAYSINASGQAVGSAQTTTGTYAVLFSRGNVINLGAPDGADGSAAKAINDSGEITGELDFPNSIASSYSHAFSYSKGTFTDIGVLPGDIDSGGASINASGQIVGFSIAYPIQHAFLYTPGQGMVNLSSLLPPGSGWTDLSPTAINDRGQITGTGTNPAGLQRAFLLSPVFTSFSTLNAVMELNGTPATTFVVGGRFVLGASSNGIDPLTQTVVVQLNGYHIAIPPSSFGQTNGNYLYDGKIGNVTLGMVIRPVGGNAYLFAMEGIGAAALPGSYPVQLTLTIGDDTGTEQIQSGYNGPAPTPADLCQYFHLFCGS